MKRTLTAVLLVFAISSAASLARADVPPPETEPCRGKHVGDACVYYAATGACQDGTCPKADYSRWDRDASSSPPVTNYACVKCVPGATSTDTKSNTSTGSLTGTNTAATTQTSTNTATNTKAGTGTETSSDDGACSVGRGAAARKVAPWFMAATFSLLFLAARRRRR